MNPPYFNDYKEAYSVRDLIATVATKYSGNTAFSYRVKASDEEAVKISFRRLAYDVRCFGTEAISMGMSGSHCALIGRLSYHWIISYLGLLSVGAVVVPLDRDWTDADLADTVKQSDCKFLIYDNDISSKAEFICNESGIADPIIVGGENDSFEAIIDAGRAKLEEGSNTFGKVVIDPDALAILVYTSGTTGKGKGVMLTQRMILTNIFEGLKLLKVGKKTIATLPPHHTFGSVIGILAPMWGGAEIYISSGLKHIVSEMKNEKPDFLILVPLFLETFYRKIKVALRKKGVEKLFNNMLKLRLGLKKVGIRSKNKLFKTVLETFGGNLTFIVSGGAPLSDDVFNFFMGLGIQILNGYGITECSPLVAVNRIGYITPGSVGIPILADKIKIDNMDENGDGEICVSGPNVMLGYYKDPDATADCFDGDGYFHTGDIGRLDEEGRLYITGRLKNLVILSNGKNVYPEEIEKEICDIPGVLDVVVYEGISARGVEYNTIVAEFYMDSEFVKSSKIEDAKEYLQPYIERYNKRAIQYKKISLVRVRDEDFPKNTLKKIMRFKIDRNID